jgi:polyhydroxyalkanoate synthesis repressor PhaR
VSRLIKRYANRKLYDTHQSAYVTLDDISELVRAGEDVQIIDNTSQEDLTAVTLAQILFEAEKRKQKTLPLATLRQLIQSSGELLEKTITRPVANIRQETGKRVTAAKAVISRTEDDARDRVAGLMESTQRTLEDVQLRVDESLWGMRNTLSELIAPDGELARMRARTEELEVRLARIEASQKGGAK